MPNHLLRVRLTSRAAMIQPLVPLVGTTPQRCLHGRYYILGSGTVVYLVVYLPSPEPLANNEATTTRKCKFFDALARDGATRSLRSISKECGITEGTGRY